MKHTDPRPAQRPFDLQRLFIFLVLSMHLAGVIGLLTPARAIFQLFTPLHILATTGMLLYAGRQDRGYLAAAGMVAVATFLVELAGVQTGLIFGEYAYGATLGPKLGGTPLLIGVNWVLLSFSIGHLLTGLGGSLLLRAALGATLMVGLDVLIEPVAMRFDFWDWSGGVVPLQNYLGWWGVSLLVFLALFRGVSFRPNPMAPWIWGAQLGFFLALNAWGMR
jgi:bisanhydrobacterioruberin hydratase